MVGTWPETVDDVIDAQSELISLVTRQNHSADNERPTGTLWSETVVHPAEEREKEEVKEEEVEEEEVKVVEEERGKGRWRRTESAEGEEEVVEKKNR